MIHLITGGSGSGKSAYAENELLRVGELQTDAGRYPYVYAATMRPYGEETMRKIMRHRQMRAGKGFVTLECPSGLSGVALPENRGVLLECVSNLAANELFCEDGTIKDAKETAEKMLKMGKLSVEEIASCFTELSVEDIQEIEKGLLQTV